MTRLYFVLAFASLLLAVLTHVGAHLNDPGHAMPARDTPIVIRAIAYVLLAVGLVAVDRERGRSRRAYRPRLATIRE